jgi:DNA helicase-2/ATP-dependent DNA helicase PcrA
MHIPYQLLGVRFFERKEIKDMLSYIRLILNSDSSLDLKRVINTPARGIGKVTVEKVLESGNTQLAGKALISVNAFFEMMAHLREFAEIHSTSETVREILQKTKMIEYYKEEPDGVEKIENLEELVTQALSYDHSEGGEGLEALLEDATLMSDQDNLGKSGKGKGESGAGVKLMTIHAAKGLEFDIVFITGLEQGLFPHERDRALTGPDGEEERRLMYVALTRARTKLYLTYASFRTIYGARDVRLPSEFLNDIPDELIERDTRGGEGRIRTFYLD